MQAAKDSFYLTLRDRLAAAYPARTFTIGAVTRPAIVVVENEKPTATARQNEVFHVEWGEARLVSPAISTLMAMTCTFSYASAGSEQNGGLDRGRALGELDSELLGICSQRVARKYDNTGTTPVDLGSNIFWTMPAIRPQTTAANCVAHEASLTVYFYPEVNQA